MNPQTLLIIAKELRQEINAYAQLNREELAWAAGLFDGEGHIGTRLSVGDSGHRHRTCRFEVGQKDRQVLDRLQAALGGRLGQVTVVKHRAEGFYSFRISSWPDVQAAVAMLWTWLSPVKREQAAVALSKYKDWGNSAYKKLSWQLAKEIRHRYRTERITQKGLALEYGVAQQAISYVLRNRIYEAPSAPAITRLSQLADRLEETAERG